jgi:hypothetical protein
MDWLKSYQQLPVRVRLAAVLTAGVVLLLIFSFSVWNQYFADTLAVYAPSDSVAYIHFSLPKIKQSARLEILLQNILADFALADVPISAIRREAALVVRPAGLGQDFYVLLRLNSPDQVKKILKEKNLPFIFLDRERILLGPAVGWRDFYFNQDLHRRLSGNFSFFSSLNIYLSRNFTSSDLALKILSGFNRPSGGDLFFSFVSRREGLKLAGHWEDKTAKNQKSLILSARPYDIFVAVDNFSRIFFAWQEKWRQLSPDDLIWWQKQLAGWQKSYQLSDNLKNLFFSRPWLLVASVNGRQTDWPIVDYDWRLALDLDQPLTEDLKSELEQFLIMLLAWHWPQKKSVYLSDGTKITELKPDPEQFSFTDISAGIRSCPTSDNQLSLWYKLTKEKLIISNNQRLLSEDISPADSNYLKIKTGFLPAVDFWRWLAVFNYLEVKNGELWLK